MPIFKNREPIIHLKKNQKIEQNTLNDRALKSGNLEPLLFADVGRRTLIKVAVERPQKKRENPKTYTQKTCTRNFAGMTFEFLLEWWVYTVIFTGTTRGGIWPKMEHSTFSCITSNYSNVNSNFSCVIFFRANGSENLNVEFELVL